MTARLLGLALGGALAISAASAATSERLSTRDSFRIGSAGVLCTAQSRAVDPTLKSIYDRGWSIVCRDAAAPVGRLYAIRAKGSDPLAAVVARRATEATCRPDVVSEVPRLGGVAVSDCTVTGGRLGYRTYAVTRGGTSYVAEGLAGYDSALRLGLAAIVADQPIEGEVQVATTSAGDPAAFARVQAGSLDPEQAMAEGYLRNNAGAFAESAEFFDTLVQREGTGPRSAEYLANQALQQSNLGNFAEADALFGAAERNAPPRDPVIGRIIRNFRAIHLLNQRRTDRALAELDRRFAAVDAGAVDPAALASGEISPALAQRLNREAASLGELGGVDSRLTPTERAAILDGQAQQLRGVALRLKGEPAAARAALERAAAAYGAVRGGRVASTAWLRSEAAGELALIAEGAGNQAEARRQLDGAIRILEIDYPASPALLTARARLAAYLGRQGQADQAIAIYREVVAASERIPGSAATLRTLLAPYFRLLAARGPSDPNAVADMFAASQVMLRPGVAQTQAVLARELASGNDAAAGLFRQSVALTRDIQRATIEAARLAADPAADATALQAARDRLGVLEREQTGLQSQLGEFPRYRVLTSEIMPLAEFAKVLKPGEAYYKLVLVGGDAYGLVVSADGGQGFRLGASRADLEATVAALRDSIVMMENGQAVTYPFDVARARALYGTLFDPVGERMAGVTHLIFEPDGPLLQLPVNLLVAEQAGVDAYLARTSNPQADAYDMRGIAWLGRTRDISTSVSPRSFADVRALAPSTGRRAYLGLGENAPPPLARTVSQPGGDQSCAWPLATWQRPIKPDELYTARGIIGQSRAELLVGAPFNDTALMARSDLADYRIVHFATHGLVTAPRPECPARPALVTSFGPGQSDGLLTFREIYDLRLDADAVILSACDTAGMASVAATREAGIATGGNFALDGLVRAFVGAGSRTVVASHWPLPDQYDATKRLVSGMFEAGPGEGVATALRRAELRLMDTAETSHPYYWSAFAVVGDGARPLLRAD